MLNMDSIKSCLSSKNKSPQNPYRNEFQKSFFSDTLPILIIFSLLFTTLYFCLPNSGSGDIATNQKNINGVSFEDLQEEKLVENEPLIMKIMTFNLRFASATDGMNSWQFRKHHVFDLINRYHPVIMGTQEGLKDQLEEIHRNIDSKYSRFGDEREKNGEYEQIFWDDSVLRKVVGGNFWLSDHPEIPGQKAWGAPCVRMTTWCKFQIRSTGKYLWFFNTQFDHISEESRIKSAKLVWKKIQELTNPLEPLFLVGDFNTYRNKPEYSYLTTNNGANLAEAWIDAKEQIGDVSYTYHGFQGKNKVEEKGAGRAENHIDWILYRPRYMKTKKTEVITETRPGGYYPSDHYPIQAEFIFPN